jgi:nucleoside-diphosphate-sugar epimerase
MSGCCVLILGGRGFVGAHVTRAFVAAGWDVHVFGPAMEVDLLADLQGRITSIEGGIEDAEALAAALASSRAELVVSLAAFSKGDVGLARSGEADAERALAVNLLGFRRLLAAAQTARVRRVVWASSTVVLGPASLYGLDPVDEAAARRPQTFYGLTKVLAEQTAQYYRDRFEFETCGVRLPLVFGPGYWYAGVAGRLVPFFEQAARGGTARLAGGPGAFDLMYVTDAAAAFRTIAEHDGRVAPLYHVNGFTTSWRGIADAVQRRCPAARVELEEEPVGFDLPLISTALVEREIGFRPRYDLDRAIDAHLATLGGLKP